MTMKKHYIKIAIGLLMLIFGFGQAFSNNNQIENMIYTDSVYISGIKSVQLEKNGLMLSEPVITLNSGDYLNLSFDDFDLNINDLYYTVLHCDFDWKQSEIWQNEYLYLDMEDQITDYEYSFGTLLPYVHYNLVFPNDRIIITKSGNYILQVYTKTPDGGKNVYFTKRFYVVEPLTDIIGSAKRAASAEYFDTKQEVNFTVNTGDLYVSSPFQEIKVAVLQNYRWDNALLDLKPKMVRNNIIDYNFDDDRNLFDGGNEFRYLNLRTLRSAIDKIAHIEYTDTIHKVYTRPESFRTFKNYIFEKDANGKYFLETDDERSVNTMGEYAEVHFRLSAPAPNVEGDFYVAGRFNDWKYNHENIMTYDYRNKMYTANIILKQGYYDYVYMFVDRKNPVGDVTVVEGNHSETVNIYTVLVYYKAIGSRYDRLIGFLEIESGK